VGIALGWPGAIVATLGAVWSGALWGLLLIALRRANRTSPVPFGAFLSAFAIFCTIYPHVFITIAEFPFR